MTKCGIYWKKVQQFRKNDDFDGFCDWCQTGKDLLLEEWKIAAIIEKLEISSLDSGKLPADAFRPLIRKENEAILSEVLPKVRSFLKNGEKLTRFKTEEFIARARGVCKGPAPRIHECESPYCMMAVTDGSSFCSEKCEKEASKPTARIQQKKYDPLKPSWREQMHPLHSRMENEVIRDLQAMGWDIGTGEDAIIPLIEADGVERRITLPILIHGPHHKKSRQQEWDAMVEKILVWRRMPPAIEWHERYSEKRKNEIVDSLCKRMIEGYRAKGLPLPVKVQEKMEAIQ